MELTYIENKLCIRNSTKTINLGQVTKEINRPFYLYHLDEMIDRLRVIRSVMPENTAVHYAMKANDNPLLLKRFEKTGVGVDLVSGGELDRALACGYKPESIVFSGVGKTKAEINAALIADIKQLNVESPSELKRIGEIARQMGKVARVALRMNPDVKAETHPYIQTGFRENKFGMDVDFVPQLTRILNDYEDSLELVGLTMHIGSQIREIAPFREAIKKLLPVYRDFKDQGFPVKSFDVGGGIGIDYEESLPERDVVVLKQFGEMLKEELAPHVREIIIEPGRIVVARFGWLFGEVQYVKETPYKNFAILNTGMHHLMRPALYQAHHKIVPIDFRRGKEAVYDVVGPICESTDTLGRDRLMPEIQEGDWLAICDAGAYGAVMASRYNAHDPVFECIFSMGKIYDSEGEEI